MGLEQMNAQFALDDGLVFQRGKGGFIEARIHSALATAVISTYAAQALSYRPNHASGDLLFVSSEAHFTEGSS